MFSHLYDKIVPNSFRVVVDGDIVCGLPPTLGYQHIGTQVVIDKFCSGSIIVDPSFVERRLRTSTKTSITAHILSLYKQSLVAVRDASMYIQRIGVTLREESADGREVFNRAKQEVDQESNDHFFLEKIYGLLNESSQSASGKSSQNFDRSGSFAQLSQDSAHCVDTSGSGTCAMDVSIRGSQWKSSSSFGYDDVFTLNTSEHGDENDVVDGDSDVRPIDRARVESAPFELSASTLQSQQVDHGAAEDLAVSDAGSSFLGAVFSAPLQLVKRSASVLQQLVMGEVGEKVNEDQVESMLLLQRSAMQRNEEVALSGGDSGAHETG